MAYHGYLGLITNYSKQIHIKTKKPVKILEIGVDTGITGFAILNNLNISNCIFEYTGIDILMQLHVKEYFKEYMTIKTPGTKINLIEKNSLDYLPVLIKEKEKFDIILVDGDHNYETVKKECISLASLCHDNTLFIFDDYKGKFSVKDMFYGEKPEYKDKNMISKSEENFGIKKAIDDFIEKNNLTSFSLFPGTEPICVINKNNGVIIVGKENEK